MKMFKTSVFSLITKVTHRYRSGSLPLTSSDGQAPQNRAFRRLSSAWLAGHGPRVPQQLKGPERRKDELSPHLSQLCGRAVRAISQCSSWSEGIMLFQAPRLFQQLPRSHRQCCKDSLNTNLGINISRCLNSSVLFTDNVPLNTSVS